MLPDDIYKKSFTLDGVGYNEIQEKYALYESGKEDNTRQDVANSESELEKVKGGYSGTRQRATAI